MALYHKIHLPKQHNVSSSCTGTAWRPRTSEMWTRFVQIWKISLSQIQWDILEGSKTVVFITFSLEKPWQNSCHGHSDPALWWLWLQSKCSLWQDSWEQEWNKRWGLRWDFFALIFSWNPGVTIAVSYYNSEDDCRVPAGNSLYVQKVL